MANKQFNFLNNDYEMTFNSDTTVAPCYEEVAVPQTVFNFEPLNHVSGCEPGSVIGE